MRSSVRAEPAYQDGEWEVPNGYDYTKPTHGNYAAAAEHTGEVYGNYKEVRATRDVDYHGIYSRERQLFQGEPSPTRASVLATAVASCCCSLAPLVCGRLQHKVQHWRCGSGAIRRPNRSESGAII